MNYLIFSFNNLNDLLI